MSFPRELVEETARRTLEEAAFVFADSADPEAGAPLADVAVAIDFAGPTRGRIVLASTKDLAVEVAANMLGGDPDDPEAAAAASAALAEILNIFAGTLVRELFGPSAVCHLGIPSPVPVEELASAELRIPLLTDTEQPLEFRLHPVVA